MLMPTALREETMPSWSSPAIRFLSFSWACSSSPDSRRSRPSDLRSASSPRLRTTIPARVLATVSSMVSCCGPGRAGPATCRLISPSTLPPDRIGTR